jgi:hypothetical protein
MLVPYHLVCGVTEAADPALSLVGRCTGMKYANITIAVTNLLSLCEAGNTEELKKAQLLVYKTVLLAGFNNRC